MNKKARLIVAVVLAGTAGLFAIPLLAQDAPPARQAAIAGSETAPALTLAEVEAGLAAIEADTGLEDAVKAQLRPTYQQAIEALKEAAGFSGQAANFRETVKTGSGETEALRSQLQELPSAEGTAELTAVDTPEELQKAIDSRRVILDELTDQLSAVRGETKRVKERPFEISSRLPQIQRELSDIRKQLASPKLADEVTSPGRVAERILLQAEQSRLLSEAEMLKQEQLSQSVREELLEAQSELLQRRVDNTRAGLATLETLADERLASEAARVGSLADQVPAGLTEADEVAQSLAVEVRALAKEFEEVVLNLKAVKAAQGDLMSRLERLTERYEGVREQLAVSTGGRGMARVLLDMQRQFPGQLAYVGRLTSRLAPLDAARLGELEARVKLRTQPDIESRFANHRSAAVTTLVTTRRDVLEQLRRQYAALTRALAALEGSKRRYLDTAKEVRAYAAEQIFGFGTRSAAPISVKTLSEIPNGLRWFFRGEHWVQFWVRLQGAVAQRPFLSAVIAFLVAVLLFFRRRIAAALEATGTKARRVSTDRYAYTVEALLWTVLLAIPMPLLIGFVGWALEQTPEASDWTLGIAAGMRTAAWIGLGLALLAAVSHPDGLGTNHFRLKEKALARLRRAIRWFAVVYIPALLITLAGTYEETAAYMESVGRFSFMLANAWMVIVLWQLLNFTDGMLATFIRDQPGSLIARWRYLWLPLVLAFPLVLVVLAGLGYIFTAIILNFGFLWTAAYIAAGTILYRLTHRWFRIKERKLALAEVLERRRARQEAAATQGEQERFADVVAIDPDAEEELNLVTISEHTRELLRLSFGLGVAVAIVLAWSEAVPVIATLDVVPIPFAGGLTLLGLTKAVLTVVVTYIAARNLPGLLELAFLRATTIDAGTRHAIATLCQYAAIAIGFTLLFQVLNVDWVQLGWIVAALSVGIGFGLQEVVANFVCGLIVLFERPIRVGDFVTVSGTTGTVTKIRIRATTITNGDRQDFVVPNKTLITSPILNWTLTAGLNRVIIRVGVASETDTENARQILLNVAGDHPLVLDEPAPMATFEQFGASSLDLVLYAFLPDLANRTRTITELHTEINQRFAAAGIEIPNPQLDLHLPTESDGLRGTIAPSLSAEK